VSPYITGAAIAAVAAAVIFGGAQRISSAAEKLVPAAAAFYVLGGAVLIAINHSALPGALNAIFHDAFSFKAVSGGAVGIITSKAIRFGISRGVSSNEAGVGTSSIAHASANAKSPIDQAMWGCVEVFIDTIVICTVTALVILTSGISIGGDAMDGARLAVNAFSRGFGSAAGWGVAAAIVLFAFTTIIGWSHYGHTCLRYLGGGRWMKVYDALVLMAVFIGSAGTAEKWWRLSDTLNGLMCIPNLIAVAALSGTVIKMLKAYRN
jgi:AGCS family alanine or glycine:cation symporter